MYDKRQREYYWPNMVTNVYPKVRHIENATEWVPLLGKSTSHSYLRRAIHWNLLQLTFQAPLSEPIHALDLLS